MCIRDRPRTARSPPAGSWARPPASCAACAEPSTPMSRSARSGATPARPRATSLVAQLLVVTFAGCATLGMMESIASLHALGAIQRGLGQAGDAGTRQDLVNALRDGGRQALASGDLKGAIGLLEEYVKRDPGQVQPLVDLGKAYWQSGQQGEALTTFRRVLELSPGQTDALRY